MFITTTLPYINSHGHIGHAFEFVLADAIKLAHKHLLGKDVHLNVGLDEHGLKVWQAAQAKGVTVEEHVTEMTIHWKTFCREFQINYDSFYKTSTPDHHEKVQAVWDKLLAQDDIYKKTYSGKYCVGCEAFKAAKDLDYLGACKDHPTTKIQAVSEENYFFRLTKYVPHLSEWLASSPKFLLPTAARPELVNLIADSGDISISRVRESCPWGVQVPGDESQVMYVWFDALLNYIFAAGYPDKVFDTNWKEVVQLCGPDNLRFQAIIFQSFLAALGLPQTNALLVHGTVVDETGQKMSKSLGNGVDPMEQLNKYGIEAIRYYMLGGLNTYATSSWSETDLVLTYNAQVANDWGNMISRVLHLIDLKGLTMEQLRVGYDHDFAAQVLSHKKEALLCWESFDVKGAVSWTNQLVKMGNKYINDHKIWASDDYENQLSNMYYLLFEAAQLYRPIIPGAYPATVSALKDLKKTVLFAKM